MSKILLAAALLALPIVCLADPAASLAKLQGDKNFIDVSTIPGVAVDLRYASANNFTGGNLYGGFNHAYLHIAAASKLRAAAENLAKQKPGYKLLVLDALRPRSVQQMLWDRVRGTEMQRYVADPAKGSVHNYGFAVDITIVDADGKELDMGTPYDAFDPRSQPVLEARFLQEGKLTEAQLANRKFLRNAMQDAGFRQLSIEWWHYDALPPATVRKEYSIIE